MRFCGEGENYVRYDTSALTRRHSYITFYFNSEGKYYRAVEQFKRSSVSCFQLGERWIDKRHGGCRVFSGVKYYENHIDKRQLREYVRRESIGMLVEHYLMLAPDDPSQLLRKIVYTSTYLSEE